MSGMSVGEEPLVIILGAGASLGVREQADARPPLGNQFARHLDNWLSANDSADLVFETVGAVFWEGCRPGERQAFGRELRLLREREETQASGEATPFEGLMNQWSASQRTEDDFLIDRMSRLVALSMLFDRRPASPFEARRDGHDELLRRVVRHRQILFVTVNYDVLHELLSEIRGRRDWTRSYVGPAEADRKAFEDLGFAPRWKTLGEWIDSARSV